MLCLRCAGQFAPVSRLGVADAACAAHFREPELGLCPPGGAQVCLAVCTEYSEELALRGWPSTASPMGLALHVQTATLDEDLCQPFRLAHHQAVTGIDLDERLRTADRFNIFALHLRREGTIPQGQNPDTRNAVGQSAAEHVLRHDT